ncbi:Bicoid-interacting protein 3-domain-containing protein, partial [Pavlovales sp. CCMP2436]
MEEVRRETHTNGSFPRYYSERGVSSEHALDPRIRAMRPDWFNGRRCLDIGCHQGNVCLALARRWCCASVVGFDIDEKLIARAQSTLARTRVGHSLSEPAAAAAAPDGGAEPAPTREGAQVGVKRAADGSTRSAPQGSLPVALALSLGLVAPAWRLAAPAPLFPHNVRFEAADFTQASAVLASGSLDTILCLSTSKWVHLNGGDRAIKAFFAEVYRLLAEGGVFVLEPQPWSSYRRKKHVSETARAHYAQIRLRPERFPEFLVDHIGFRAVEQIKVEYDALVSQGFASRPMYLFVK